MKFFEAYPFFKLGFFLTFNMVYFVIGIMLQWGGSSEYGSVILRETSEWNKGVLTDVQSIQTGPCPDDYTMIKGVFSGTKSYCGSGRSYTVGSCSKKKKNSKSKTGISSS